MTGVLVSKKVVETFGKQLQELAQRTGFNLEIMHLPDGAGTSLSPANCDRVEIAYLSWDWRTTPDSYQKFCDVMAKAKNLKWVHFISAGIDQFPFVPELVRRGITLTTSAGTNSESVAQLATTGLLVLARKIPLWIDAQRRHAWESSRDIQNPPPDLRGQTVMVVGLGKVGMLVASVCMTFGMQIIGIRRAPKSSADTVEEIYAPSRLVELLPRCQWVVICCPYTKDTHHLVNAEAFAALPHGAHVINVARGSIIEEPALIAALQGGHLGGAYLDVVEKEPLAADSPLWDMQNVFLTPHVGGIAAGHQVRSTQMFVSNLNKWIRGEPMQNVYQG